MRQICLAFLLALWPGLLLGEEKPPVLQPTFASIYEKILVPKCVACHSPGASAARVALNSIEDLVNPPNGDMPYVIPGDPTGSRLWIVTDPTNPKRMPPARAGLPPLAAEEHKAIEEWIQSCAL